jgi:toxin YoeB
VIDVQANLLVCYIYPFGITQYAEMDIERFKKAGDKKILIKIYKLLEELREHPTVGTGKPAQLKYYEIPTWSRRITQGLLKNATLQ